MIKAATTEAENQKLVDKIKTEDDQARADYSSILNTPAGYRWFRRFFLQNSAFDNSMTGNSKTFYNEGHRACALKVWSEVVDCDEDIAAKLFIDITKTNKEAINE